MRGSRAFALLIALAVIAVPVAAQKPPHRIGPIGGLNFASLEGDDTGDLTDTQTSWFAGVYADLVLARNFAITPELLYSRKGGQETSPGDGKAKLDYIEVPVLAKLMFPTSNGGRWALRPQVYAGPSFAYQLNCEVEEAGTTTDCNDLDPDLDFKDFDFGILAGAGISLGDFDIGARYTYGVTKLVSDAGVDQEVKNRVFSVYVGWGFRLTR